MAPRQATQFSSSYQHLNAVGPTWPQNITIHDQNKPVESSHDSAKAQPHHYQQHAEGEVRSADWLSQYNYQPIYQQTFPIGLQQVSFNKNNMWAAPSPHQPQPPLPPPPPPAPPLPASFTINNHYLNNMNNNNNNIKSSTTTSSSSYSARTNNNKTYDYNSTPTGYNTTTVLYFFFLNQNYFISLLLLLLLFILSLFRIVWWEFYVVFDLLGLLEFLSNSFFFVFKKENAPPLVVPAALIKAMTGSPLGKKPFTYTPGGLDLSHIRESSRVKRYEISSLI